MKRYLILVILAFIPVVGWGQARIYTKTHKLNDMATKITKVVLTGNAKFDAMLQDEVSSRWRINAFEFCTEKEYQKLKTDNNSFFLNVTNDGQTVFLNYSRGGKKDDSNALKTPVDIVSIPIAEVNSTGTEYVYMPAFLDILQLFSEEAAKRDHVAYSGLARFGKPRKGRHIFYDRPTADSLFAIGAANTLVQINIGQYVMTFSTDTHELQQFKKR